MPVVSAAVCPHPPLLIPEVAAGAAFELDELRTACLAAVDRLASARPDALLIVGSGPVTARYTAEAGGDFGPYGAPSVRVGSGESVLPLSLLVGSWLVRQSTVAAAPRTCLTVAVDATPAECAALGGEIAAGNDRVALLVMGDGSARRSEHAPVHLHPRAEIFDATVATALDLADLPTLAALDPDLAAELQAAGRAPWQVLAAAASPPAPDVASPPAPNLASPPAPNLASPPAPDLAPDLALDHWRGDLTYNAAPYGVGYFVATLGP